MAATAIDGENRASQPEVAAVATASNAYSTETEIVNAIVTNEDHANRLLAKRTE